MSEKSIPEDVFRAGIVSKLAQLSNMPRKEVTHEVSKRGTSLSSRQCVNICVAFVRLDRLRCGNETIEPQSSKADIAVVIRDVLNSVIVSIDEHPENAKEISVTFAKSNNGMLFRLEHW